MERGFYNPAPIANPEAFAMTNYTEITTQQQADALTAQMGGFHDSLLKEFQLTNRGFVAEDRSMIVSDQLDARILIQSQWEHVAIELLAIGVRDVKINASIDAEWSGDISVGMEPLTEFPLIRLDSDNHSFSCRRLFHRMRPTWHGIPTRFGDEIPTPKQITPTRLDDNWFQCPHCSDGFQRTTSAETCLCPNCRQPLDFSSFN